MHLSINSAFVGNWLFQFIFALLHHIDTYVHRSITNSLRVFNAEVSFGVLWQEGWSDGWATSTAWIAKQENPWTYFWMGNRMPGCVKLLYPLWQDGIANELITIVIAQGSVWRSTGKEHVPAWFTMLAEAWWHAASQLIVSPHYEGNIWWLRILWVLHRTYCKYSI